MDLTWVLNSHHNDVNINTKGYKFTHGINTKTVRIIHCDGGIKGMLDPTDLFEGVRNFQEIR